MKKVLNGVAVVSLGIILGFSIQFVYAWVSPTQSPPNGNVGAKVYTSDCNLFAVNGWKDKNECLQDGRWHMVQNDEGVASADLVQAIHSGADIRITHNNASNARSSVACGTAFTYTAVGFTSPFAYCNRQIQYGGSVDDLIPAHPWIQGAGDPSYSFGGTDPQPHSGWGSLGSGVVRSDGRTRGVSLTTAIDGTVSYSLVKASIGSVSELKWYVRY